MTQNISLDLKNYGLLAGGYKFDEVGSYEILKGWAYIKVDPKLANNAKVVDIEYAPTNKEGTISFSTEIFILRPADTNRGNGKLFFDYGNRGNKRALQYFNDAVASNDPKTLDHCGNGFLFRRGYTIVWAGWQGDLLAGNNRLIMDLPVARDGEEKIKGTILAEFIASTPGKKTFPLSGQVSTRSHPTISLKTSDATFTRRRYPHDQRQLIPNDKWLFAREEGGIGKDFQGLETALVPSHRHIHLPDSFETGWIYELIYTASDPLIMGLGHVAVRDFISFLRYEKNDENPLAKIKITSTYCFGRSQTGRCIRDSIYLGFNEDLEGRKVFDGVLSHVAGAGKMWLNHRFCNAVVPAGQQYEDHNNIADQFPFSYAMSQDHLTGKSDAICKRPETDPLIFHSQTSTEYWQRRGSLVHTDTQGNDLAMPENVRLYFWASAQHVGDPLQGRSSRGICQNPGNVVQTSMFFRGMLDALDDWATKGIAPPENKVPQRIDGTLITIDKWREQFPNIPGINTPKNPNFLPLYDYGPMASQGIINQLPPIIQSEKGYTVLVPAVDIDGNDIAGIRAPMVSAPLATYTGWNLRARFFGEGAMHEFSGSTIEFPETKEIAESTGDPRESVLDRYGDEFGYLKAIESAAKQLVREKWILEEDLPRVLQLANRWCFERHDIRL